MPQKMGSAPTIVYPESDGKPMAETDVHRRLDGRFHSDASTPFQG